MKTEVFERFLDSAYGRKILKSFNKYKEEVEDPPKSIIAKAGSGRHNYLDIGGGTGARTMEIAEGSGARSIDFVEPSRKASEVFAHIARNSGIRVKIINSGFEEFRTKKKYDLITAIHSWYYIDLESIERAYSMLKKGGIMCIFASSKNDTIKRIQNKCELYAGFRSNNAEDVCRYLDKAKINYKIHRSKQIFSNLLKGEKLTQKTKAIMSLVTYSKWSEIPDHAKDSVIRMLKSSGKHSSNRCLIVIKKN